MLGILIPILLLMWAFGWRHEAATFCPDCRVSTRSDCWQKRMRYPSRRERRCLKLAQSAMAAICSKRASSR